MEAWSERQKWSSAKRGARHLGRDCILQVCAGPTQTCCSTLEALTFFKPSCIQKRPTLRKMGVNRAPRHEQGRENALSRLDRVFFSSRANSECRVHSFCFPTSIHLEASLE